MPVTAQWIRHEDSLGFLAWPERARTPLPSVLVIQEIWGVDEHIKDVTRRIAAAGYLAYAPDLYAKDGIRPEALQPERVVEYQAFLQTLPAAANTPADRAAALSAWPEPSRTLLTQTHQLLFGQLRDLDKYLPALHHASNFLLRTSPLSSGQKLACVGFSMGGGLAGLLSTSEPELSGAAIFYGSAPPIERVPQIASSLIGFYAGLSMHSPTTASIAMCWNSATAAALRIASAQHPTVKRDCRIFARPIGNSSGTPAPP